MLNFPAAFEEKDRREYAMSHLSTSESTLQPLRFTDVELTDDDQFLHNRPSGANQRNTLQVDIRRVSFVTAKQSSNTQSPTVQAAFSYTSVNGLMVENRQVHERMAKRLVHTVGLCSETVSPLPLMSWAMKHETQHLESVATLTFRYIS
ncbi:hypothetical protein BDV98DRAFT_585114 [Pterulicium gracile]|uniref:Uncharacterized protein n=1 Tax=Pterulicium gracile TaxID=1884261 RepID=A0A5C3QDK8_9AGAR|nr:hypothetical protein BDV98DRAFT_585114 [Pterula gracilis]